MKKYLFLLCVLLVLVVSSYVSFSFGEKNIIQSSTEQSRAVLREYRALNYSLEGQSDIRFLSIIDVTDKHYFNELFAVQNHQIIATIKPVQSRNVYLVLFSNGLINEVSLE